MFGLSTRTRVFLRLALSMFISGSLWAQRQPPDTQIMEPEAIGGPHFVQVEEEFQLRVLGIGGSTRELSYEWKVIDASTREEIDSFNDVSSPYRFSSPGTFIVTCAARIGDSLVDPTPDQRVFVVAEDLSLSARIIRPRESVLNLKPGDTYRFSAIPESAKNKKTPTITFKWSVIEANAEQIVERYEGLNAEITFPRAGRFTVLCHVEENRGFRDPTPDVREVIVADKRLAITNPEPSLGPRSLQATLNQSIIFQGLVEAPPETFDEFFWLTSNSDQPRCLNQNQCTIRFTEPGIQSVALMARKDGKIVARDYLNILVDPSLLARLDSPSAGTEIAIGAPLPLTGSVIGKYADQATLYWAIGGKILEGKSVTFPGFSRPGYYQVQLIAAHRPSGSIDRRSIRVLVYDTSNPAIPQITAPRTNLRIRPGTKVFCDSSLKNSRLLDRRPRWEITREGSEDVMKSSDNLTLGRYGFSKSGTYHVKLFLMDARGKRLVDNRTVKVADNNPSSFDGNNTQGNAADIQAGQYENLSLSRPHFFSIDLPERDLELNVRIKIDVPAVFTLFDANGQIIISRPMKRSRSVQTRVDKPGRYTWSLAPIVGKSYTGKKLDFGFSVAVLNPSLYLTEIVENERQRTRIGLVNVTNDDAELELVAYDREGYILTKANRGIQPQGALKVPVAELFPKHLDRLAWVRVDSTRKVVGFTDVRSIDNQEAYGVSGISYLDRELFVPHIAQRTDQWFTRATVINGQVEQSQPILSAGGREENVGAQASYTKESFDFLDKFGGTLPSGVEWGVFEDRQGGTSLAGSEVFGRVDGFRHVAGLGLANSPADNPNFANYNNTFYFTHIARNVAQFWTGIALVNIQDETQTAMIRAYGENGTLVGEKPLTLNGLGKSVSLADTFLDGIGDPSNVDWVEVEADGGIVGYELFGTWNNKQMAGLEAIGEAKQEICFPFIDVTGSFWHGFAVVNVENAATEVEFSLYDEVGNVLGSTRRNLSGKAKQIFLIEDLFGTPPLNASWVKATSDRGLAGFQLYGDQETMSGLVAQ